MLDQYQFKQQYPIRSEIIEGHKMHTIYRLKEVVFTPERTSMSVCVRMTLKTAWDRLLSSFMFVAATVRDLFPSDISDSMSCESHVTGS